MRTTKSSSQGGSITIMAMLLALLVAGCAKDDRVMTFSATTPYTAADGKIQQVGLHLNWASGDAIKVYDAASNAAVYTLSSSPGNSSGYFEWTLGGAPSEGPFKAFYPSTIGASPAQVDLPAIQNSPDGKLTSLPLYAVSASVSLRFFNICGVVRFILTAPSETELSSIEITTDRNINGTAAISGSGSLITVGTPDGSSTSTLVLTDSVSLSQTPTVLFMYLPAATYGSFVVRLTAADGTVCTKTANTSIRITRGKVSNISLTGLTFAPESSVPAGAVDGLFSVSSGHQVYFSHGNLRYRASDGVWRFADNQYDYVGSDNANISDTYSGWIDLFGWGTSGWNSGANAYQPYSTSGTETDYRPGRSPSNDLTGDYANADWGVYNQIENGGDEAGLWRTLTNAEWTYLLGTRPASTLNNTANARYAKAQVCGVGGVMLFPDSYIHPAAVALPTSINVANAHFDVNVYAAADWALLEKAGVVFLPAAGLRNYSSGAITVTNCGVRGYYWSSTHYNSSAYMLMFHNTVLQYGNQSQSRVRGISVRLVQDS